MGYKWVNSGRTIWEPYTCVRTGILLRDGDMYSLSPSPDDDALLCSVRQLPEKYVPPPRDIDVIMEQFRKISERMDVIAKKVDEIYEELHPKQLNKNVLKRDKPGTVP